jgi:hypothetical protein
MSHLKASGGFEENGDKSCDPLEASRSPLNDEGSKDIESSAIDPDGKNANGVKFEVNHEIHPNFPAEDSKDLGLHVTHSKDDKKPNERHETKRILYSQEELCGIIRKGRKEHQLANHKEILFRLFLNAKYTELAFLMNQTNLPVNLDIQKPKATETQCNDAIIENKGSGNSAAIPMPSPLSLVPLSLTKSKVWEAFRNNQFCSRSNGKFKGNTMRSDYYCLSLLELESKILTSFETSSIGKEAIGTDNQQFSWFLNASDNKYQALSSRLGMKKRKSFSSISLVYNECSLSGFAKWAFTRNPRKGHPLLQSEFSDFSESQSLISMDFPAPIVTFRMCQLCKQWGHYELECTQNFSNELTKIINLQLNLKDASENLELLRKPPRDDIIEHSQIFISDQSEKGSITELERGGTTSYTHCSICKVICPMDTFDASSRLFPKSGLICPECCGVEAIDPVGHVTDIESCEGFVIEQRSFSNLAQNDVLLTETSGIDFERWSRVLISVNGGALDQIAAKPFPSESLPVFGQNQQLRIGEFCWAKREHAPSGKLGRDEWWPAQVISMINSGKQVPYFSVEVTPYLVKMYGAAANRVRASSTLPFFRNFRNVAMRRLNEHSKSSIDRKFRKGVMEIITLIGFKSIEHAMLRADEIAKKEEHNFQASRKRMRSEKISNSLCKSFKLDGFQIHARRLVSEDHTLEEACQQGVAQSKERISDRESYKQTKLVGCCVAWLENEEAKQQLNVGTVLAANIETKMALVSAIPQWKSKLKPAKSVDGAMVQNYDALGTEWLSMEKLHVLSGGKEEFLREEISEGIIATLLSAARLEVKDVSNDGNVSLQNSPSQIAKDLDFCNDNGAPE